MDDLISRAAALDALGERPVVWSDNDDYTLGARNQYDMDRLALETVPFVPPAQKWIPISEGLPEMTDTYLVQVGVNENGEGMHTEARTADWNAVWQTWYVHTTRCLVGDIIKWMPIPWEGSDLHEG